MIMKRFCIVIFVVMLSMMELHAQMIPVNKRFGKVSEDELKLSVYEADTSAVALVLYEGTDVVLDFDATGNFCLKTSKHVRLKILKEEGVDWADFELIHYDTNAYSDLVRGVEVVTFNLEDGKVKQTKMPRSNIFEDAYTQNYRKTSFSAANVKVGSVVEVKYEISSYMYWVIDDIYFQKSIPVNHAECNVRVPDMFAFNKNIRGFHPVESKTEVLPSAFVVQGDRFEYNVNVDRYSMYDLPAFKKEPYLYNSRQYYTSLQYNIRSLAMPGAMVQNFGVTWNDVDKNHMESDLMQRFNGPCQFKDEVKGVPADVADVQRIEAAMKIVKSKVVWNGDYKLLPVYLSQVVKAGSGSNADINCLLAGCLREMGFAVDPVMVRLRSSGNIDEYLPEMSPYDTFVIRVKGNDGTVYYLDGGSDNAYVNVLNPQMLVTNGRLLSRDDGALWIDLTRLSRNSVSMTVNASFDENMSVGGKAVKKFSGIESYMAKSDFDSYDDEEGYIDDIEYENRLEVTDFMTEGNGDYSSELKVEYEFIKESDVAGNVIYVSPFVERFHSRDAFQSMTRTCPMDFPFPYNVSYMFTLNVPEGYSVEQLPTIVNVKLKALDATLRFSAQQNAGTVNVVFSYIQNGMTGKAEDYQDIRLLWQQINDIYDSMIVLKKVE